METGAKVLIVDDEPIVGRMIQSELTEAGFRCRLARNSDEVRDLITISPRWFDLVIADIMMPGMTGLDLLAHISRIASWCRVILMTPVFNREYLAQAIAGGAFDYLEKPMNMVELVASARRAVTQGQRPHLAQRAAAAMEVAGQIKSRPAQETQPKADGGNPLHYTFGRPAAAASPSPAPRPQAVGSGLELTAASS